MTKQSGKILYLTLKKEFFDEILRGKKTSEFREYKPYWIKRLQNADGSFKKYDHIYFRNGYHINAPLLIIKIKRIKIIKEKIDWFTSQKYFEIELGEIIEIRNNNYV